MAWLRKLLRPNSAPAHAMRLDSAYARQVAILHHFGGFARGWEPAECAALMVDAAVVTDGVFCGRRSEPVGFIMSRKAADEAEILSIVIAPGHRGDGLGGVLLAAHLARLGEEGVAHVFLEVEDGNEPAERLYRHFDFREVGRRKGYYPKADGTRVGAIAMRLDLA